MFKFPKIIDIQSGEIIDSLRDIDSGKQNSSILNKDIEKYPQICFNRVTSQIAIRVNNTTIKVLTPT